MKNKFVICILLLLAIGLVFGQTVYHDFLNLDDAAFVCLNPHITGGLTAEAVKWAFTHCYLGAYTPMTWITHMLDCQILWSQCGRTSSNECAVARRYSGSPLSRVAADDRQPMAQRFRGGGVRNPSSAGRIGGLGYRTQGCSQRVVLRACSRGIRAICASPFLVHSIFECHGSLCVGPDGQADAGNAAVCVAVAGLLAARTFDFCDNELSEFR